MSKSEGKLLMKKWSENGGENRISKFISKQQKTSNKRSPLLAHQPSGKEKITYPIPVRKVKVMFPAKP